MSLWILDTDHVTLLQKSHPNVLQHLDSVDWEEVAITVITIEEQIRGWFNVIKREAHSSRLVWAYAGLRDTLLYLRDVNLLSFDRNAYNCYLELRSQKIRIGSQDLRIAAIALSLNGIVVTRNQRDFSQIPNLRLEDWTIAGSDKVE